MGYTHYYKQKRDLTCTEWDVLKTAISGWFRYLRKNDFKVGEKKILIADIEGKNVLQKQEQLLYDNGNLNDIEIGFNGIEFLGEDHEPFMLTKNCEVFNFEFCKTAKKPYDFFVMVCLILADRICKDAFEISSDGAFEDWAPAAQWMVDPDPEGLVKIKLPKNIDPTGYVFTKAIPWTDRAYEKSSPDPSNPVIDWSGLPGENFYF